MTTTTLDQIVQTMKALEIKVNIPYTRMFEDPSLVFIYSRDGVQESYEQFQYILLSMDKREIIAIEIDDNYRKSNPQKYDTYVKNVREPLLDLFRETRGNAKDPRWRSILN